MVFLTCDGYTVIAEDRYDCNAPAICRRLETERDDGYCVVASRNGELVADADGWWSRDEGSPPYDAATATGMYDRY